jgi:hypothetical protein
MSIATEVIAFKVVRSEDIPVVAEMENGVIYIVGPAERPWLAALRCPCGCGSKLLLNLSTKRPAYRLARGKEGISISPAVTAGKPCRAKFSITNGLLEWM